MANNMLNADDFNQILDEYAGRTISHIPVVQTTSNLTGEETLTDQTAIDIKCYVMKTNQSFNYKEVGFIEQGDVVCLAKVEDNVKINSKLIINGEVFRVKESFDVPGVFDSSTDASLIYSVCNLYLES